MPAAANRTIRQLGLLLFLAAVGLSSGQDFASQAFTLVGLKNAVKGKGKATKASSGNVADYEKFIPDVKEYLDAEHPKTAKFYAELTPGYQRDWARYIYSAKQPATQEKRKTEMLDILGKGHKTKNLYQQWLREQE